MPPRPHSPIALCLNLRAGTAATQALSWSGFGTAGVAQPDRGVGRDRLLGVQADLRLSRQWSATARRKRQPALRHGARWHASTSGAVVAWWPGDNGLLRAGRQRLPVHLHAEAMDLGQTHRMGGNGQRVAAASCRAPSQQSMALGNQR